MMWNIIVFFFSAFITSIHATNFTIINGQIFTPGLAIIDAPQPETPLGGDSLQVAIDISGDGKLQLPPYPANAPTAFFNITIFLTSYITGLNFTITNGTAGSSNASLGDILKQEPGSTVKHVNWIWPDCLVGNGLPKDSNSSRGSYNISLHQSFTLNATTYYTIFSLPIQVTNSISAASSRPSCSVLTNPLLTQAALDASSDVIPPDQYPWTNGRGVQSVIPDLGSAGTSPVMSSGAASTRMGTVAGATMIASIIGMSTGSLTSIGTGQATTSSTPDFGGQKPDATPGDGLGSGSAGLITMGGVLLRVLLALSLIHAVLI